MAKVDNRTSLEKSHSKSSNAKLTLLCFVASVFSSLSWASLALAVNKFETTLFIPFVIAAVVSLALTFLCIKGLGKFTR